jgi:pimeloyl-ACP methyl ester carboxylesterase
MEQMTFNELTEKMIALYREGKFDEAHELLEQNSAAFPEQAARLTYWRMCVLSLGNRREEALSVFRQALDAGLWWNPELFVDPDLNAIRELPEFQRLMAVSKEKYEQERTRFDRDYAVLLPEPSASGRSPLLMTLHGRNGNKDSDLEQWEAARQRGWLVLSCQSTQPVFPGAYHWDDPAQGMADLHFYYEQVLQKHEIDMQHIVIAGFSQGSGMAIYTARKGDIPVRGFIGIGTWWADADELGDGRKDIRGYFIVGEQDHTLERAREIQAVLRENHVDFAEEVHTDLGHQFSTDFATSFERAIEFIFKEQE